MNVSRSNSEMGKETMFMSERQADRDVSVLLVEDSAVLAERLRELLETIGGANLTGVVDNERAAVEAVGGGEIDVILLDLRLRQGTGFGVMRSIGKFAHRPVIIVLTNYDLAEYRLAATALGAEFFLDKARDMDQLPGLIGTIRERMKH